MTDIAHADLTGTELHEPKGIENATLGTVYVADGNGSGSWNNIGASSFTGMIADFAWPVVQEGWLECDGSDINTTTYSALYATMTIQMTGTRTSGSAVITSLASTSNMRVGYYAFGIGIPSGTTIVSIDSSTQITLSTNVSSPGTSTVVISPWLLGTGTIRLPDLSTAGRYRRSRSSSTKVGELQSDTLKSHTHTGTSDAGGAHSHTFSGNTGTESALHTHQVQVITETQGLSSNTGASTLGIRAFSNVTTTSENQPHTHAYSGTTSTSSTHTHTFTTDSTGTTETRPVSIVMMTCVKT